MSPDSCQTYIEAQGGASDAPNPHKPASIEAPASEALASSCVNVPGTCGNTDTGLTRQVRVLFRQLWRFPETDTQRRRCADFERETKRAAKNPNPITKRFARETQEAFEASMRDTVRGS